MASPAPWLDDYDALKRGVGAARLDGWSCLTAEGPDAGSFLQSFSTNDVLKLEVGAACEAFFPDVKGRVLAFGWVWRTADQDYRVVLGSGGAETLASHLDRYLIREQVELAVDRACRLTLVLSETPVGPPSTALPAFGERAQLVAAGGQAPRDLETVSPQAFTAWRIELGVPLDGVDVDSRNLPQEVDRDTAAISFTKGCYLGQETVARIDALGRVNQLLRRLYLTGPEPHAGAELRAEDGSGDSKPIGVLKSVCRHPRDEGWLALAYMRRGFDAPSTAIRADPFEAVVL